MRQPEAHHQVLPHLDARRGNRGLEGENALAYVNTDRIEAAYRRTGRFERRSVTEQWNAFLVE